MTAANRPAVLNRSLVGVIGLILLAGGAFALLTGLGVLRLVSADASLLLTGVRPVSWAPVAATAVAVVVGLLCVRWLAAQGFRRPKTRVWRLEQDPGLGFTRLATDTATKPFVADIRGYDGVSAASAWLTGSRTRPALQVTVVAAAETDLGALRQRILDHAVARLRQALELDDLPAQVQFHLVS